MNEAQALPPPPSRSAGLRTGLILIAVLAAIYVVWQTYVVWLAGFLAIVFAVVLHGIARWTADRLHLRYGWSLGLWSLALLLGVVGIGWWLGPALSEQFADLSTKLPESVESLRVWLEQGHWGRVALDKFNTLTQQTPGGEAVMSRVAAFLSSTTGALGGGLIVIAMTLFLAATPDTYRHGLIALVSRQREPKLRQLMTDIALALRWWFVGQVASMATVGVFTGLGLWLIGVPLPWALGLIAAVCSFVPNIGPIVAALPGLLLAMSVDGNTVLWAGAVYVGVQLIETNVSTPILQRYVVDVPPALLLIVQMMMGTLFGILGLIVATPLMVTAIVIVQRVYVRDQLGRDVTPLGRDEPEAGQG